MLTRHFPNLLGYFLFLLSFSANATTPRHQPEKVTSNTQDIGHIIETTIKNSLQPFSGSILLLEHGTTQFELQIGEGVTYETSFVVASLSKQITATLVMQAVDEGKLDLARPLNSYLFGRQEASILEPERFDHRITLHHLLSNTSGIAPLGQENHFEPGSKFAYSNLGYALLGQVLEKVNKQPFSEQVMEFAHENQLGQLYSAVGNIGVIQQKVTSLIRGLEESESLQPTNLEIDEMLLPAGGLIASARAFASFQHRLHSGKLISAKSYRLMTKAHTQMKFFWPNMSYGYGLRINTEEGISEYSHTGYLPGYMSMSLHYPQFNIDLVMLENISLNLNDINRVLELHTQIRNTIREQLMLRKTAQTVASLN
ncbi:serine hydrolase domain-containing protein [Pseudoalteromonas sp. T1lg23B]|uniref:serine hydrolase domain-containing protein n=1 Tax=Pseudoalteromonas sp. T1lg23B TaxID=2077097 RepID=UPI000CF62147|nr:serine hydrolase [Pseudoalteromonas sp. T1lg23B]